MLGAAGSLLVSGRLDKQVVHAVQCDYRKPAYPALRESLEWTVLVCRCGRVQVCAD